jgi:hypothetical protein
MRLKNGRSVVAEDDGKTVPDYRFRAHTGGQDTSDPGKSARQAAETRRASFSGSMNSSKGTAGSQGWGERLR